MWTKAALNIFYTYEMYICTFLCELSHCIMIFLFVSFINVHFTNIFSLLVHLTFPLFSSPSLLSVLRTSSFFSSFCLSISGQYLEDCRCSPCSSGFYTCQQNREDSCHRCFQRCKPGANLHHTHHTT